MTAIITLCQANEVLKELRPLDTFFLSGQKVILCAILNFAVAIFWHTVRNIKPRCSKFQLHLSAKSQLFHIMQ